MGNHIWQMSNMAYVDEVVIRGRMLQDVKEVVTCCILSFGWLLSVWILCADVLEHSVFHLHRSCEQEELHHW